MTVYYLCSFGLVIQQKEVINIKFQQLEMNKILEQKIISSCFLSVEQITGTVYYYLISMEFLLFLDKDISFVDKKVFFFFFFKETGISLYTFKGFLKLFTIWSSFDIF